MIDCTRTNLKLREYTYSYTGARDLYCCFILSAYENEGIENCYVRTWHGDIPREPSHDDEREKRLNASTVNVVRGVDCGGTSDRNRGCIICIIIGRSEPVFLLRCRLVKTIHGVGPDRRWRLQRRLTAATAPITIIIYLLYKRQSAIV